MPNNYELHIGFPIEDKNSARKVLDYLQSERRSWVYSEVYNVDSNPEILDPHNVPGTLGYLVSKDFVANDVSANEAILHEAQRILSVLSKMKIRDARLEIEFVFGYSYQNTDSKTQSDLQLRAWPTPFLDVDKLNFKDAERILATPNSEIHFVIEPISNRISDVTTLTTNEASKIVADHRVNVQQTIEYRSQAMREARTKDKKLICTSYYEHPHKVVEEAYRLINESNLSAHLLERGYTVKLVLERIFGCFRPVAEAS